MTFARRLPLRGGRPEGPERADNRQRILVPRPRKAEGRVLSDRTPNAREET